MILKQCILTRNDCYTQGAKITKVTGIVVHSTGANNTKLKRYVQPLSTDEKYADIIADIGKNIFGNHWNKSYKAGEMNKQVCVHAFIGKNGAGAIETYQILPFDICCWGAGKGAKGSYNFNPIARIQFEICEDGLTDRTYFEAVFKEAAEFCAYLCKRFALTADQICSHAESYRTGYGGNHSDPDHWLKRFHKTMDDFRSDVRALLSTDTGSNNTACKTVSYKIGDVVDFTGTSHYTSSFSTAKAKKCKAGKATITQIIKEPVANQPYTVHLKALSGGASTVYGWVNASDIRNVSTKDTFTKYLVKVTVSALNIRKGPGTDYAVSGVIRDKGTHTVVEESTGKGAEKWGRLKSGAGWISLRNVKKL